MYTRSYTLAIASASLPPKSRGDAPEITMGSKALDSSTTILDPNKTGLEQDLTACF